MMDYDASNLYPSAMWDDNSIYSKIETGFASTPDINDELVKKLKNQTFTEGSAYLKMKDYNPPELIVQHLPVNEKFENHDYKRIRYISDTLTSADIQENAGIGGRYSDF